EEQTAGRGRLDRHWLSPAGQNIYCSIILKELTDKPALLTILAALAVKETLQKNNTAAELKWPNDVLAGGRKICGILAEASSGGLVIGIGVNVNMKKKLLEDVGRPATSMLAETGQLFDRDKILNEILENFFVFYEHVLERGFASLRQIWQNELHIIGAKVRVQTIQKEFDGTVLSVDDDGALIIETARGLEKVLAGDIYVV
ncbi:MAG: biotin--[acetyl-CoA-carboxylase] ligase, partial [Candidatus Margulisbacteria bacterium]|nr:biotin--[acetyl-CoA-carboxylase] ligase [Candidatus Margulisiibacteriota bacterium]